MDGRPYIITECPIPFTGLREWLTMAAAQKDLEAQSPLLQKRRWKVPTVPEATPREPRRADLLDDETDSLSVTKTIIQPILPQTGGAGAPAAPSDPGEFTRIFWQSATPATQPQPPAPPPQQDQHPTSSRACS